MTVSSRRSNTSAELTHQNSHLDPHPLHRYTFGLVSTLCACIIEPLLLPDSFRCQTILDRSSPPNVSTVAMRFDSSINSSINSLITSQIQHVLFLVEVQTGFGMVRFMSEEGYL